MTMTAKEVANATDVLVPEEPKKILYGGKEYSLGKLTIKQVLSILKLVSKSEQKIRVAVTQGFEEAYEEQKIEFGEGFDKKDTKYTTADAVLAGVSVIADKELFQLISIILGISEEEAEKGFSIAGVLTVVVELLNQEEIEKIFLELTALGERMKSLTK